MPVTAVPRPPWSRRTLTLALPLLILTAWVVVSGLVRRDAAAVEPPPGGLVVSAADVGWTAGEFSVSPDGATQYQLPLWLPAGRGRVAPHLSLSYGSRAGNGLVGVGWTLGGLSSVSPCRRTFAQDGFADGLHFDGSDVYCLGGNRLIPISPPQLPEREYRTEDAMFARIVATGMTDNVPDSFTVWTRDRQVLGFGQTADSRMQAFKLQAGPDLADPTLVRAPGTRVTTGWALNRIADRNGNAATISYTRTEGDQTGLWWTQLVPAQVSYPPNRRVDFVYENRPDVVDGYAGGVHSRTAVRLSRVEMRGGPQGGTAELLRQYVLSYRSNSITGRSLLTSIDECDRDGTCKLPLSLGYTSGSYTMQEIDGGPIDVGGAHEGQTGGLPLRLVVGDLDRDGRADLVYERERNTSGGQDVHIMQRSTGDGLTAPVTTPPVFPVSAVRSADIDADGRTDLLGYQQETQQDVAGVRWQLFQHNGTQFAQAPGNLGEWDQANDGADPAYLADLDGNGLPDYASADLHLVDPKWGPWQYRLNTGASGASRFQPAVFTTQPLSHGSGNHAVDTDGDGRVELIGQNDPTDCLGEGWVGWGLNALGGVEGAIHNLYGCASGTHFGDVNGDGLADPVIAHRESSTTNHGSLEMQLNSGNGYGSPFAAPSPPEFYGPHNWFVTNGMDSGVRLVDFNNDGQEDVLVFRVGNPIGTGDAERGLQLYTWRDGAFVRVPLKQEIGDYWAGDDVAGADWGGAQPLDVDADGVMDLVFTDLKAKRLKILKRTGAVPDRLVAIGDSTFGPRTEVEYTTLADRAVHTLGGNCAFPRTCLTRGSSVVSRHRVANFVGTGEGAFDRYDHTYREARVDLAGRGWLGFAGHTVTRFWTGEVTSTEFDNVARDTATKTYPFAHRPKTVTYTANDNPQGREFRRTEANTHFLRQHSYPGHSVELRVSTVTEAERPVGGAWQTLRSRTVESVFDDFGNKDLVVTRTTGGRTVTEDPVFTNDPVPWLIGPPDRVTTTACTVGGTCTTRLSTMDYDAAGNHTVTVTEPDRPELKLTTTTEYGPLGNVLSISREDAAGNVRKNTSEYADNDKLYPTATTNARGHRSLVETHSGLGVPLRLTDPNGFVVTMKHDRFGRPREVNRSDGSFEHTDYAYLGAQVTTSTVSGGGVSTMVSDQLGRQRELRVTTFSGAIATTFTGYDFLGRGVRQVSRPALPGRALQNTVTAYDNRGRVTTVTAPDGAVTRHEYVNLETHTYDAKGVHSYTVQNVDGDLVSSFQDDPQSTDWLHTQLEYGPFAELTKVTGADGAVQSMTYDTLGWRTSLTDPSLGSTTSTPTAFGELATATNGAGESTEFRYDELGRVTRTESPDGVATNVWDNAPRGIGKLANATSEDGTVTVHRYDDLGRAEMDRWTIEGTAYEIGYTYDEISRPLTVTYPAIPGATGRFAIRYFYNPAGNLRQITDAADGAPLWTVEERDGAGQLTRETFGNQVTGVHSYFPATGLAQNSLIAGPGTVGMLGHLTYAYDANRNLTGRTDAKNLRTEQYGYDELNRLTTWNMTKPGQGSVSDAGYSYNKVGSLRSETLQAFGRPLETTTYGYGANGAPPHAVSSRNAQQYGYDDAGRQTSGPQRTVEYTRRGLPSAVNWAIGQGTGQRTEFKYDADGRRVLKRDGAQTVVYVPGLFERRSPAGTGGTEIHNLHHIVVEGRTVAQINRVQAAAGGPVIATRPTYLHTDRQGSTIALTNRNGEPSGEDGSWLRELFYDPFGARIDALQQPLPGVKRGGPAQGYTGAQHDDELGMVNMGGRVYDPEARQFFTPDPEVQDPYHSQSHHRYAYVWNNPTTRTDPTGQCADDQDIPTSCPTTTPETRPLLASEKLIGMAVGGDPLKKGLLLAAGHIAADDELTGDGGEIIEVRPTTTAVNDEVFGQDGDGLWQDRSGQLVYFDTREQWLQAQHASRVWRSPGSESFYNDMWALDYINGRVVKLANYAIMAYSGYALVRGLAELGAEAMLADIAARGTLTVGEAIPGAAGARLLVTGAVETASVKVAMTPVTAARDALAADLGGKRAMVIAGRDPATGRIVAGCNMKPGCAEQHVAQRLGINPREVEFTDPVRPGTGESRPVCVSCQNTFDRSQFPPGTQAAPGGRWSEQP